jgi:hypothetical protein
MRPLENLFFPRLAQSLPLQDSYQELAVWQRRSIALGSNWSKNYENLVQKF